MIPPSPPRELVLSVGLHKTGTTSIQATCTRNQLALLRAGYVWPQFTFDGKATSNHSGALHLMFRSDPARFGFAGAGQRRYSDAEAANFRERFRQVVATRMLAQAKPLLMVAEGASTFTPTELREMRDWFAEHGWSIRVICFVRHLSSWLHSMVAQRVAGMRLMTIDAAVAEFVAAGSLVRQRIENVREVFPDARFESFERGMQHPQGVVGRFLAVAGVPPLASLSAARANEGRSDAAVRLLSAIAPAIAPQGEYRPVQVSERPAMLAALATLPGPKFRLRRAEVAPLQPLIGAENEWLRTTLGEEFHDPTPEFAAVGPAWGEVCLQRLEQIVVEASPLVRTTVAACLRAEGLALRPLAAGLAAEKHSQVERP